MKRSLVAALLLLALTAHEWKVTAVQQLDSSPDAVDDMYQGCREKAIEKLVSSELLEKELKENKDFHAAWNVSQPKSIPRVPEEQRAALWAYFNVDGKFIKRFNDAVETLGVNATVYEKDFHFKSIHFLLTDAIRLLNPKTCTNVYKISDTKYRARNGSKVRFGKFTFVQTDLSMKEDVDEGTYFNITTCFMARVEDFCPACGDKAVISPAEEFVVVDQVKVGDVTEIVLKSSGLTGTHNCYIVSRSAADVSTLWVLCVLLAAQLFTSS